jgi:type I restriction enzyme S subunit
MLNVLQRLAMNGSLLQFVTQTSIAHLPKDKFETVPIPLPPTNTEQEAIAEALSDADALIGSLDHLLAKKRHLKQGAMQELLSGKKRLPGFQVKPGSKQTEVGVIPEDWDTPGLGVIIKSMQLGGNYKNSERQTNWPLIKMGNLGRGSIKLDKLEFIDSSQSPAIHDRLHRDNVLFNTRNTLDLVGKVAIWRNELPVAYFNSNIMRMEFDGTRVSSCRFMNYILNTPQSLRSLRGIAIGTTSVAAIYSRDLVKLRVPLPTKAEQTAIATILSDMDAEIAALEEKLAKAHQIKTGMMQELLTGRIRLIN